MTLFLLKLFAALLILIITLLAGLSSLRRRNIHEHSYPVRISEAAASGIFLGAALFHMLPNAELAFQQALGIVPYPYANLLCALSFVLLLLLEKINLHRADQAKLTAKTLPTVLALVLSVHAFTEGAAFGINTTLTSAFIVFIAILAHKGSESFALAVNLAQSSLSQAAKYSIFLFFSFMTPLGILFGYLITNLFKHHQGLLLEAGFNAFAAGTFLYIATLHQLQHPGEAQHCDHFQEFLATLVGLSLMAVIAIWV